MFSKLPVIKSQKAEVQSQMHETFYGSEKSIWGNSFNWEKIQGIIIDRGETHSDIHMNQQP